jgi:hypothetical protein
VAKYEQITTEVQVMQEFWNTADGGRHEAEFIFELENGAGFPPTKRWIITLGAILMVLGWVAILAYFIADPTEDRIESRLLHLGIILMAIGLNLMPFANTLKVRHFFQVTVQSKLNQLDAWAYQVGEKIAQRTGW